MKILLAPDSFKGSLSSSSAADAMERGILKVFPKSQCVKIAIADGGEGTLDALRRLKNSRRMRVAAQGPLGARVNAEYAIVGGSTAIVEMAKASGLTLVGEKKRDIMKASTFGTGEIIAAALKHGARNFLVGLGGSATNDAGIGMLAALGYEFYDAKGKKLEMFGGENLKKISRIESKNRNPLLDGASFTILSDVNNPLFGKNGAAYVYAPQKGASTKQVGLLDEGLKNFAQAAKKSTGKDFSKSKGAGAAGGIGAAFLWFLDAKFKSGIDGILDLASFDKELVGADLVITGEGRIDAQSVMGKAVSGVAARAKKRNVPVVALAGSIAKGAEKLYAKNVSAIFSICASPTSLKDAMNPRKASKNIEFVCENICRTIRLKGNF